LIDWLIDYGFTPRSRIFHLYGDVTIAGEVTIVRRRAAKVRPMLALRAFDQGGIFIVPHAVTRDLGFSGLVRRTAPFSCLLWQTREYVGSILTQIHTVHTKLKHFTNMLSYFLVHARRNSSIRQFERSVLCDA
jgi:hypothetical protein